MPRQPTIAGFLADTDHPVTPDTPLWDRALPGDRHGAPGNDVRYGDYFRAVSAFLLKGESRRLLRAAADRLGRAVRPEDLGPVSVFLEKHGAFYHPARVRFSCAGDPVSLVVNVAASAAGRSAFDGEVCALGRLAERSEGAVPKIYAADRIDLDDGPSLCLFLGQWFEGFHEFHLSRDPSAAGRLGVRIWNPDTGPHFPAEEPARQIYREAARILTDLYDPVSLDQVLGWHHGAGDFVVRLHPAGRVEVRLITVRNYAPLVAVEAEGPQAVVEGLVLFSLGMTLAMRLDRLDGVAETVWADDWVLESAMEGLYRGLTAKEAKGDFPAGFAAGFFRYLVRYPEKDLADMARRLADRYPEASSNRTLVRSGAADHIRVFQLLADAVTATGRT